MKPRRLILLLLLLAIPVLVGGNCTLFFSSGGDSDDSDGEEKRKGLVVVVNTGNPDDLPVRGLDYRSGSITDITGSNGEYRYESGGTVRFFIGDIALGGAVEGKPVITPADLVSGGTSEHSTVVNITRLLLSLDATPDDGVIIIPEEVRTAARRSNEELFAAIEYLDFADDTAFVNAATRLVAVLTRDYPFTAVLLDAEPGAGQIDGNKE